MSCTQCSSKEARFFPSISAKATKQTHKNMFSESTIYRYELAFVMHSIKFFKFRNNKKTGRTSSEDGTCTKPFHIKTECKEHGKIEWPEFLMC